MRGEGSIGTTWRAQTCALAVLLAAVLAPILGYTTEAYAAPGDLDYTFDDDGKATTDFTGRSDTGLDVAVQEDGKVVVSGSVVGSTTGTDFAIARYNPDGSPDTTFGTDGMVITPIGPGASNDDAYGVAVRSDGKIVAAGFADNYHPGSGDRDADFVVVRYDADGSLDDTFGSGGKVITDLGSINDYAVDVALQGTKTVLAGRSSGASQEDFTMVRYDDAGNLDTTFGTGGVVKTDFFGAREYAEDIAIGPGGQIVLAGFTRNPANSAAGDDFAVARYNADGDLDTGFGTEGKVATHFGSGNDSAYGVVVQEDGKIVLGGKANTGSREDFALARYNTNGSLDDEFHFDGKVTTDVNEANGSEWLWDLALQDDGRIVAAGNSTGANTSTNFALVRYNTDGTLNSSFSNDGKLMTDFFGYGDDARSVALQEDGRIVAAGVTNVTDPNNFPPTVNFAVARYFGGNDATAPKVKPPVQALLRNSTLGTTGGTIRLTWSATDLHGEVTRYELQRSKDGGPYTNVNLPSEKATGVNPPVVFGSSYRFRVRAWDDSGNRGVWKYGPRFTAEVRQENAATVSYTGAWQDHSMPSASGGAVRYAGASGAKASFTFTGRNVAWVAPRTPNRGRAEVWLDGAKVATVDLYSATAQARKVVYASNGLNPTAEHTLEVRVLGTKRAVSRGTRVDVDAFTILR